MNDLTVLWYLPIAICLLSGLAMIYAGLARKDTLLLAAAALILINANSPPINAITAQMGIGFGTSWVLLIFVAVILTFAYRLHIGRVFFSTPNYTGGLLLFLAYGYFLVISPAIAYDHMATLRRGFSFMLVFIVGWRLFGLVFRQAPEKTRSRLYAMLYAIGLWGVLVQLCVLVVMGPIALERGIGGSETTVILAGRAVSRLQIPGLFPATGLAETAALGVFFVVHLLLGSKGLWRLLLGGLLLMQLLVLLWSAGRTAMAAFWATSVVLAFMSWLAAKRKIRPGALLLFLLLLPMTLWGFVAPLWLRGEIGTVGEAFVRSRLHSALEAVGYLKPYLLLGAGSGALDYAVEQSLGIKVETFFFQALAEFGIVGGLLYIVAWLSITVAVLRADFWHLRRGNSGAWLPSSGIVFTWLASIASFGFGLFRGNLAIWLAVGAAAFVELKQAKLLQSFGEDRAVKRSASPIHKAVQ